MGFQWKVVNVLRNDGYSPCMEREVFKYNEREVGNLIQSINKYIKPSEAMFNVFRVCLAAWNCTENVRCKFDRK